MTHETISAPAITLTDGIRVVCDDGDARRGDPIEVHVGDDLIGRATLKAARRGGQLTAQVRLQDVPRLDFPARLRVMNARSLTEIKTIPLTDTRALIDAAGAPGAAAVFAGLHARGVAFDVSIDRLGRYSRPFALHLSDGPAVTAMSAPHPETGSPQRVVFGLARPVPPGTTFRLTDEIFGTIVLSGTFDTSLALAAALAQLAELHGQVADLHAADAAMRRRLDTAIDMGRERLLLDRLDLFYVLLCERIDRASGPVETLPPATIPQVHRFEPAEVDGIGIFDVESDGGREWRWFGPDATIALRDIAGPVRRVVLYFHSFGDAVETPEVRVSTGGAAEPARLRCLEPGYALDVPVSRASAVLQGVLIVHLSFDRHQTSLADPRLLSAVFSGAEVILASV